jgi:hypothetical protein
MTRRGLKDLRSMAALVIGFCLGFAAVYALAAL